MRKESTTLCKLSNKTIRKYKVCWRF